MKETGRVVPNMSDFMLRTCHYQDLDRVVAIEKSAFPDRPYSKSDFMALLLRAKDGFIIAEADDGLLGYVIAVHDGDDGMIQSIAVSDQFRRRGIGEVLMSSALNHLAECERVFLLVDSNNVVAISLYHKLSFKETGNIKRNYYPNGDDAVEMVRTTS
jgi:ribosomal-protein-alanine N-acetyltransferase